MHVVPTPPTWLPWLQSLGVLALGALSLLAGTRLSRLPARWWLLGYLVPLLLIFTCGAAFRYRSLELTPPFSWLVSGRRESIVLALATGILFGSLLPRLPILRQRVAVGTLATVIVAAGAAWPLLAPTFARAQLAALVTRFDADGICIQNTDYTCGPAATVTALKPLGITAEEGELAILCGTTASTGTPPDLLANQLNLRFRAEGLQATHRAFRSVAELRHHTPALAWVKFAFLTDHVVAVLEVTPENVHLGDPLRGKRILTHTEFAREWRFVAVTLQREPTNSAPKAHRSPGGEAPGVANRIGRFAVAAPP